MTFGSGGIGGLPPSGPSECLPDAGDCSITHSATGWCLVSTGQPVILLVTISCETGSPITITTLDPNTGTVLPNGPVVPCGDKDWEINQLCDVDPITGEVIATVTQIFEWDETTGAVVIRLERPDAPGIPYVPTGVLQTCAGGQLQAVETVVCGNTAGILRQLTEVVLIDTLDGTIKTVFYLDNGALAVLNPGEVVTAGDCWTQTLPSILDELEEANGTLTEIDNNTDGLEACCATTNANLTTLISEVDQVEELLTSIDGHVDGLEACCASTNAVLNAIQGQLNTIIGHVDGIEGLLTTITGQLTTVISHIDGIEGLLTTGNATLAGILSAVDGLEACCAATNAALAAIQGQLNTVIGHVDGIEGLIAATNAALAVIIGHVDGLEALLTTSNNLQTTANGFLQTLTTTIYDEDTPHLNNDPGQFILGVRNDTNAVRTSANGDYSPISVDSAGRVKTVNEALEDCCVDGNAILLDILNAIQNQSNGGGCYDPSAIKVQFAAQGISSDTTLYVVPPGQTLLITSLTITIGTDSNGEPECGLTDGVGGPYRMHFRPNQSQNDENMVITQSFCDPLEFTTSVRWEESGDIDAAINFIGRLV